MKKLYPLLFVAVLLLSDSVALAQSHWTIKLYQNSDLRKVVNTYYNSGQEEAIAAYQVDFSRLSLALHLSTHRKWEHELSFSYGRNVVPVAHQVENSDKAKTAAKFYAAQYEFLRSISKSEGRFHWLLGGSTSLYFAKLSHHPLIDKRFFRYQQYIGNSINANAHVVYKVIERLSIDMNMSMGLYDVKQYLRYVDNPAIPEEQKFYREGIQHKFFPKAYVLRLGIGYQIK